MTPEETLARRRIGDIVGGKWSLVDLLGTGGMGAVFVAEGPSNYVAAVKLLHPQLARDPEVRERLAREGYIANTIEHPGVVRVFELSSREDAEAYLVMERLRGGSLKDLSLRPGGISLYALLDYLDQTLDVLATAHDAKVIHRDLKPDNLFVTTEGRLKVLDFGIARIIDGVPREYRTRTGMTMGTMPYMPVEQALGRHTEIDGRTDLYALGALVFRLLSGRPVFQARGEAALLLAMTTQQPPSLSSVAQDVPHDVCAIVDRALRPARVDRYPDARTMQGDIRAVREGRPPPFAGGLS